MILSIGGLRFRLQLPVQPKVDKEIAPFVIHTDENVETVDVEDLAGLMIADAIKAKNSAETASSVDILVDYRPDAGIEKDEVTVSPDADCIQVHYRPENAHHFAALRGCLIYIPMEQVLLAHDRFFLHASFVTSPWGGLLFTGDSGVGKSTQAELWHRHMGSTIINGDRAIVAKEADERLGLQPKADADERSLQQSKADANTTAHAWRAYGSCYAGSSGYYLQADAPIRAIILLEQAPENQVDRVSNAEAFRRLMLQCSVDYSRTEDVDRLCDLLAELMISVPVLRLRCRPDEGAVQALCEALREEAISASAQKVAFSVQALCEALGKEEPHG